MITRTITEIAEISGATLEGDGARTLVGPAALADAGPDQVSFLARRRYAAELEATAAGAVLVPRDVECSRSDLALLRCDDPNTAFTRVVEAFRPPADPVEPGVHPTAVVADDARIGDGASVGALAFVGARTELGAGAVLAPGVIVGADCRVGPGTVLHAGVVLETRVTVGARCRIHAGTVLGSDGFGFEPTSEGWAKVPQVGTVEIGDDVEIGAGCAVDRGRFGPTRIGDGAKLDNLVHVGHNVVVEERALLVAQVGVSGSSRIGAGAILGGQVGVAGHVTVGPGARVGGGGGVTRSIEGGRDYWGMPAREKSSVLREMALSRRLGELVERVRELERRQEEHDS